MKLPKAKNKPSIDKKIEACNHPRAMLITTQKENIRCAKCKKLWVPESALQQQKSELVPKTNESPAGKELKASPPAGEEVLAEASYKLKPFRYISRHGVDITEQVISWDDLFDICKANSLKEKENHE